MVWCGVSVWWITWDLVAMCLTVCLIQCSAGGTDGAAESRPQQRNGPDGEVHHSHYPDLSKTNQATLILPPSFLFLFTEGPEAFFAIMPQMRDV